MIGASEGYREWTIDHADSEAGAVVVSSAGQNSAHLVVDDYDAAAALCELLNDHNGRLVVYEHGS